MPDIPSPIVAGLTEAKADTLYAPIEHYHTSNEDWGTPAALTDPLARAALDRNELLGLINAATDLSELKIALDEVIDRIMQRQDALVTDLQAPELQILPIAPDVANTVSPSISGWAFIGETLTLDIGEWNNAILFAGELRYVSDDTVIDTITGDDTYVVQAGDEGEQLYLSVTAYGTAGDVTEDSAPTNAVSGTTTALTFPTDNPTFDPVDFLVDYTPEFTWNTVAGATSYRLEVDETNDFASPVIDEVIVVPTTSFTPGTPLAVNNYYARVRMETPIVGAWSAIHAFGLHTADTHTESVLAPEMWLPFRETAIQSTIAGFSNVADNAMYTAAPGAELLTNPGVISGVGTPFAFTGDNPDGWTIPTETPGTAEITELAAGESFVDAPTPGGGHAGFKAVNTGTIAMTQNVLSTGDTYRSVIDTNKVTSGGIIRAAGGTGGANIHNGISSAGVSSCDFVSPATFFSIKKLVGGAVNDNDVTVAGFSLKKVGELDGYYHTAGVTPNGDTFRGQPCPTFAGTSGFVQLEFNRLESLFKPENSGFKWSVHASFKIAQTQAENTTFYGIVSLGVDNNNRFDIYKSGTPNEIVCRFVVAGNTITLTANITTAHHGKWVNVDFTIDKDANALLMYLNGVQVDSDAFPAGTWTASALTANFSRIGSVGVSNYWQGSLADVFMKNAVLSTDDILNRYNLDKIEESNMS